MTTSLLLLLGAAAYGLAVEVLGVTFNATPLLCGLVVLAAAAGRRELVPAGLALVGWGTAVLLVREGGLPDDREAPAFMAGAATGLLIAYVLSRREPAIGRGLGGGIATVLGGGLALYLSYDLDWLGKWPAWAAALALAAAWQAAGANPRRAER